jgi:hypothetical protein
MITSVQNHIAPAAAQTRAAALARPSHAPTSGAKTTGDFQKLFTPSGTTAPVTTAPRQSSPLTSTPTHPASGTPQTPAKTTSSPWLPAGFPGDQDLMNPAEHEATMNAWLQNYTQWSNDQKTQIYQQAMADWQTNNQRCQDLGLPAPPKPTPPILDAVEPKPTGWWFQYQG